MKKNAMLKIAAILVVAVLLTTCAISSTFAKYVTNVAGTAQTARVAKWGVDASLTAASDTLFLKSYTANDDGAFVTASTEVIAPGTSDSITYTVAITEEDDAAAEVSYASKYVADVVIEGFGEYMPLVFTVNGDEVAAEDLEATIEAADAEDGDTLTIAWSWAYYTSAENDELDTALGDAADATVSITVGLTVYQTGPAVE